jgi:hypothetical protein
VIGVDLKERVIEFILDGGSQFEEHERDAKVEAAERKINRMTNVELLEAISDALREPGGVSRPQEIFVFGSNVAGRHGKGAALTARQEHSAEYGVGEGRTGMSYAIPTKDYQMRVRSLVAIKISISKFVKYATQHPELKFNVTDIGCGLAGYKPPQIAALFSRYTLPDNIVFTGKLKEWVFQ